MQQNTIIIICGPTAVGKTAAAIELAKILRTDIISADSRQCYREISIGVAKPTEEELSTVHHYFINSHSISDNLNAGVFEKYALQAVDNIFQKRPVAIMVGGTGLYIKAFTEGIDEIPAIDSQIRVALTHEFEKKGLTYLQEEVATRDPLFWNSCEQQNPQRLLRALEVILSTGKSIIDFHTAIKQIRPFKIIKIGLELPREVLYERINERVDLMIENGLVNEVESLQSYKENNALQTVGYRELFQYFEGETTINKAIEDIKTNSRRYAKRQMTWFKRDHEIRWYTPSTLSYEDLLTEVGL